MNVDCVGINSSVRGMKEWRMILIVCNEITRDGLDYFSHFYSNVPRIKVYNFLSSSYVHLKILMFNLTKNSKSFELYYSKIRNKNFYFDFLDIIYNAYLLYALNSS